MQTRACLGLLIIGFCALSGSGVSAALNADYEYVGDPASEDVEDLINAILSDASLESRFDTARSTDEGFIIVLHHNPCIDSASLNDVIGSAVFAFEAQSIFEVESVQTFEQPGNENATTIVIAHGGGVDPFMVLPGDDLYFPSCYGYTVPKKRNNPMVDVTACCGLPGTTATCDGTDQVVACYNCGGITYFGLCLGPVF